MGTSVLLLFLLLNCSSRNAEGSSPQGERSKREPAVPMEWKLLGLIPPSLAGKDKAIRCFASSILFRIPMRLASGSRGIPSSSKKLGIFSMPSPTGLRPGLLLTSLMILADLRPWVGAGDGEGVTAMGMCLTGMEMLSPAGSLFVWICKGDVFGLELKKLCCGEVFEVELKGVCCGDGVEGELGKGWTLKGEETEGLGPFENMDCMGACISDELRAPNPTATLLVASDWLNMLVGERGEAEEVGEAMLVIIGDRNGEEVGEGLLTGEEEPLDSSLLRIVEEMVLRAACFARSVFTKLETRSSRFPLRFGDASSSSGLALAGSWEMWVMEEPLWGESLLEDEGEETVDCLGELEESDAGTRGRSKLKDENP